MFACNNITRNYYKRGKIMTVINTNTSATIAANSLARNERAMNEAMERLSTGKRINNAGDDAAGLQSQAE